MNWKSTSISDFSDSGANLPSTANLDAKVSSTSLLDLVLHKGQHVDAQDLVGSILPVPMGTRGIFCPISRVAGSWCRLRTHARTAGKT